MLTSTISVLNGTPMTERCDGDHSGMTPVMVMRGCSYPGHPGVG